MRQAELEKPCSQAGAWEREGWKMMLEPMEPLLIQELAMSFDFMLEELSWKQLRLMMWIAQEGRSFPGTTLGDATDATGKLALAGDLQQELALWQMGLIRPEYKDDWVLTEKGWLALQKWLYGITNSIQDTLPMLKARAANN